MSLSGNQGRYLKGGDIGEESDAAAKNRPPGRRMGGLNPISPGWMRSKDCRNHVRLSVSIRRGAGLSAPCFVPVCSVLLKRGLSRECRPERGDVGTSCGPYPVTRYLSVSLVGAR